MEVIRPTRDETGLALARVWAKRATCPRRSVGCVLFDVDGFPIGAGYNGSPAGAPHCIDHPCPGAGLPSGTGLSLCEAIHAEAKVARACVERDDEVTEVAPINLADFSRPQDLVEHLQVRASGNGVDYGPWLSELFTRKGE